ncbi:MAG: hypothetical protein HKN09_09655 [Saprospiraceae bacterium]|nr:hypothetical protein [Saprospiraceae bacterium]
MKKELFAIGILTMSLTACYDQFDDTTTITIPEAPEVYVDAHLIGDVKLIDETLVNQFTIDVNDNSAFVESGFINMNLDFVNEVSQLIEVNSLADGNAIAIMPIHRNATTYASIYLFPAHNILPDIQTESFSLGLIGIGQITGQANTFNTSSTINAFYRALNDEKLVNQLGHRGLGPAGEIWAIDIHTAFEFNFQDSQGQAVELPQNNTIRLELTQVNLEDGQVLLHLDETLGIWKFVEQLDGLASVTLGETGYYAFANVQQAALVRSVLKIEDKPVSYQDFVLGTDALRIEARSVSSGEWLALVPVEEALDIEFLSPCGEILGSSAFDPISEDIYLPPIEIAGSDNYFNISADVIDCSGNSNDTPAFIVSNGANHQTYAFMNTPDVFVPVCNASLTINATDLNSGEIGPSIDWDVSSEMSLDILSHCMSIGDGYAFVRIGEDEQILEDFIVTIEQNQTIFKSNNGAFTMRIAGTSVESYNEDQVNITINDTSFGSQGYFINCDNSDLGCGITQCDITHFAEEEGEWYRVQFEGEIWVRTINPPVASYQPIRGEILTKK